MIKTSDIKDLWPAAAFNIDDEAQDTSGKTAYDRFVDSELSKAIRRLQKWLGADVIEDAVSDSPINEEMAFDVQEALSSLIHSQMIEHLMRSGTMGIEKEVSLPSGQRIVLALYSRDDFERAIRDFSDEAYRSVEEYL
jgi:hypothetical protein